MLTRPRTKTNSERGAVVVMVAVWLPVLALFVSFAIDFAHFFDYSRNLQNRADAAALAAGVAYGGACFGDYTTTQTDVIGEAAQQYSGPPNGTPNINLPYAFNSATPYQNQPNLTKGTPANYHVLLNSTDYWNQGGQDWNMGSGSAQGSSLALCSSTDENGNTGPMADVRVTQANLGLFFPLLSFQPTINAHARVTLEAVGGENNIVPLAVRDPAAARCVEAKFFNATTNAQIGSDVPLTKKGIDPNTGAVQWDNSSTPASVAIPSGANVYVQFVTGYCGAAPTTYDSGSGLLYINSWSTGSVGSGQAPAITSGGVSLIGTCPSDGLSNQYFTNETCAVGVTAHVSFASGIPYTAESVTATDTSTGNKLTLSKLSTTVNGSQTVLPGATLTVASTAGFTAPSGSIDVGGASYAYTAITPTEFTLTAGGTFNNGDVVTQTGDTTWTSTSAFQIAPPSGQHLISITAKQTSGTVGTQDCATGGGCTTSFGVQQQAFGACNDGDPNLTCANPPDDSGSFVLGQLRLASDSAGAWASDPTQTYGRNAFAGGSTQSMVVTVELQGLSNAKPGDKPTVLRFSENAQNINHATGLINCGQGQSNTGGISALINGCPTVGTAACPITSNQFLSCAPLAVNERALSDTTPCSPEGNDLSGTVVARTAANPMAPVDCTGTAAGNMPPVINGLACRIVTAGCNLQNGHALGTECYSNNWSPTDGASSIPAGDPRALTMVITAPADLATNNSGQIIPIENFAVFYITGWTTQGSNPSCATYTTPPKGTASDAEVSNNCPDGTVPSNGQCSGVQKGMVWGYWMKYTDVGGIPSGEICNTSSFGNCVPALTR